MKCFLMKPISDFRLLIALRIFSKTFDSVFVEHVSSSVNLRLPFTKDAVPTWGPGEVLQPEASGDVPLGSWFACKRSG
jgi:hypothetical protein